jgi:type IV pilus assembly protein PilM
MNKATRRVGLEISNSAVRMAEVAHGPGGRAKLLKVFRVPLPPRAVVDGTVVDVHAVTDAIKRAVKEGDFSTKEVHLGVGGLRAITRELDVPRVPDSELDAAVRLQALDVIPFPSDKTLLSTRPLSDAPSEDGAQSKAMRRVLVAAAHRGLVEPVLEAVEQAGLVVATVDLNSVALVRSLYDPAEASDAQEAIVSIGSGLTTFVVHENGTPHFVRTIAEGGDTVTASIAGAFDVPIEEAERMKRHLYETSGDMRAASTAAYEATTSLISEIRSSVEYYSTLSGRGEVRRIVLTGGGALLTGLLERLRLETRAEVVLGNALQRVDASALKLEAEQVSALESTGATMIGLALPDRPGMKPLDLLPPEILVERRRRKTERAVMIAAAAVFVLLAGLGALKFLQVHNAEGTVSSLRQGLARVRSQLAQKSEGASTYGKITADEASVSPILKGEVNWPAVLFDLGKVTPPGGVVTSVTGQSAAQVTPGSTSSTTGTSSSSSPSGATSASASTSPKNTEIADLNISVATNQGFSYFKTWLHAFETSTKFRAIQFSGLNHTTGNTVTWTAELAVLGTIQSGRIGQFEVTSK